MSTESGRLYTKLEPILLLFTNLNLYSNKQLILFPETIEFC